MSDVYVYKIENSLYINLTNKCNNNCVFCIRAGGDLSGYNLWLKKEPSAQEVIDILKQYPQIKSIVFCGYGEPTYKLDELIKIATYAKENGYTVRLDTNGLGNAINGKDITLDLKNCVDVISISLNADNKELYDKVSRPSINDSFAQLIDFAKKAISKGIKVVLTAVDIIEEESAEKCRLLASELGAEFRLREYITPQQQKEYYKKEKI